MRQAVWAAGAVTLGLAVAVGAGRVAHAGRRYQNAKYGLSFSLPAGVDVCRSLAPLPNHGLLFRPPDAASPPCDDDIEDGVRYTATDARFDLDPSLTVENFVRRQCPQMAYDSQGRVSRIDHPPRPAGLPAAACRIDGADGSILEVVFFQRRKTPGVPPINYTLVLKTTPQNYGVDHAAFRQWLSTVRVRRPL